MASFGQAMPTLARPGQKQAAPPAAAGRPLHQPQQPPPPHHHHHLQPAPYTPGSAVPPAPQGTFAAGTKIQVGSHRVVIQRYLSEGGFAHVYVVKLPAPVDGTDLAVLKRVAVPDKDSLRSMRTEVETMKRLKGHRAIVTYIDSHASELRGGGYEVFLLMEYCDGGGLMDFMNTRLQHRLTEPEILAIFSDIAEGVACMHYLKPPLLHRDLKVENVLIAKGHGVGAAARRRFKLCDFGSAAAPIPAPTSVAACRQLDEDIQMHTTLQYRSPEMVDVYRRQPVDEKSDIWALGVLLYKLCYYTTPFEEQASQLAILNASYRFPSHPVFSERLKSLIASMLRENQQARPNIYQVLREACAMQGKDVPIQNIYASSSQPKPGSRPHAADKLSTTPTPVVGAVFAPPTKTQQVIPDIVPMRRGRPAASASSHQEPPAPSPRPHAKPTPAKPAAPVASDDPFAALDGNPAKTAAALAADELSARFPTLDQFTLLHDHGTRFSFDSGGAGAAATSPPSGSGPDAPKAAKDLNQRVAERLADDAFAASATAAAATAATAPAATASAAAAAPNKPTTAPAMGIHKSASEPQHPTNRPMALSATTAAGIRSPSPRKPAEMSRASAIISSTPELQAISAQRQQQQPSPVRPTPVVMVSTGTMTSPPPTPPLPAQPSSSSSASAAARAVPGGGAAQHALRASSLPRGRYADEHAGGSGGGGETQPPVRPPSQAQRVRHVSSSARPSLEGARPALDALLHRVPSRDTASASASSLASRPPQRPVSAYLDSSLDYLRERESSGGGGGGGGGGGNTMLSLPDGGAAAAAGPADSPRLGPRGSSSSSGWGGAAGEETTIESNVAYLRSMEESADSRRDRSHHHHHRPFSKRASLHLHAGGGGSGGSGKKSILSGKFGDAFKRFEASTSSSGGGGGGGGADGSAAGAPPLSPAPGARTPSPLKQLDRQDVSNRGYRASMDYDGDHRYGAGAAAAGFVGPGVDDNVLDDADDRTPEARREIERRRLSLEEKRVAAAGAEYRQRLAQRKTGGGGAELDATAAAPPALPKSIGGVSRAVSIQNRVQNLLNESKAAAGTAAVGGGGSGGSGGSRPSTAPLLADRQRPALSGSGGGGAPRPAAKPKPMHLSNKAAAAAAMPRGSEGGRPGSPTMGPPAAATRPQLVAMDLPGQPVLEGMSMQDKDDYIRDFTRRFPSLTTIEKEEAPGRGW